MAFTEALRLIVDADTRGAVQGIEKLGATADRELSRSEKSAEKWGNRLTSLGTGMIAFGGAALVGLGAMAKASEDANLAQVKLQNTIDNMPKLAGATAAEFTDLADSIQDVTAADADAIVEAEALLGTFNLTAKEIKGITPLVVDYARKFGVDMSDAAIQVGKALDGQVGALKRNGVSIDEVLFKTDRYGAVQKALSEQVGGFAEAEGKTFAGSLERMKNQLGDLAEGVGGGAVDAFTTMFGAVQKVAGALESVSPGTQDAIGKFATFGAVGLIAAGGISTLIGQALKAKDNFSALASGVSSATNALGGLKSAAGLAGAAGALVALGGAVELYNQHQQQMNVKRMTAEFLAAGDSVEAMNAVMSTLAEQGPAEVIDTFAQLAESNRVAAERFIETAEAAGASGRLIEEMKHHLETTSAAEQQTAEDTEEMGGSFDEVTSSVKDTTTALQDYTDALHAQFDPLFAAVSASQALAEANADVTAKETALTEATRDHGAGSLEAIAAQDELTRAYEDASGAALDQEAALLGLVDMVRQQPGALDSAKAKLQQWVDQGRITQAAADATAAKFDEVTGAAQNIPVAVNTNVTSTGATQTAADLNALKARIDAIPREINIVTRMTTLLSGSQNVPRAQGGPVVAGEAYIVGEHRPELFIPNENGMIWPSVPSAVPTGSFGGAGNGTIELHSHLYLDGREVVESVKRYERNNGTSWRN